MAHTAMEHGTQDGTYDQTNRDCGLIINSEIKAIVNGHESKVSTADPTNKLDWVTADPTNKLDWVT